ncbi:MAG: protein disulfide isomerase family protein [Balneola sp.]
MKAKFVLSTLLLVLISTGAYSLVSQKTDEVDKIDVIAVYMYADWCSACQNIKPKIAKAKREFENQPILFTKMDMTDDFTTHQSKLLATRIGVLDIFEENEGKTGFILLVDADSYEILDKIAADDDIDGMVEKINSTLLSSK